MGDDDRSFAQVKTRLEEIATEAGKKDTPLEKCLDLLEEGERLARRCTELIDQTEWRAAMGETAEAEGEDAEAVAEVGSPEAAAAETAADAAPEQDAEENDGSESDDAGQSAVSDDESGPEEESDS